MQFILVIPFDFGLILFAFCLIALFALPAALASLVATVLPPVGFVAMCLLTLQIYIWAFTKKPENG